jgi:hypothetical protein
MYINGRTFFGRMARTSLLILISFLLLPSSGLYAAQVTLAWDSSTDPNVTGFRVFYGTSSHSYPFNNDAGKNTTFTISNLRDGATYYFVVTAYNSSGIESQFSNEVSGVAGAGNVIPSVSDPNWEIVGRGDFNGDGKPDILWRNTSNGQNAVWFMNGATVTGFAALDSVADQAWTIVGTGDFNGDGKPDILWRNTSDGQNAVWFMNGATVTGFAALNRVTDQTWTIVGTGDFNGDGKPDILWRNTSNGQNAVWFMNGATVTGFVPLASVADQAWTIVDTGDFNGDSKPDILWRNTTRGQNAVWFMDGVTVTGSSLR